jgi:hypothetical protein
LVAIRGAKVTVWAGAELGYQDLSPHEVIDVDRSRTIGTAVFVCDSTVLAGKHDRDVAAAVVTCGLRASTGWGTSGVLSIGGGNAAGEVVDSVCRMSTLRFFWKVRPGRSAGRR